MDRPLENFQISCDNLELTPTLKRKTGISADLARSELGLDLSGLADNTNVDIVFRQLYQPAANRSPKESIVAHESYGATRSTTTWILLPSGHSHRELELVRVTPDEPTKQLVVAPDRKLRAQNGAVEGWQLFAPEPGLYECRWRWE